ncbi:MAG TPA: signal peptide peptidase SppA [Terriglobales bacterium]|nr:signal peptide peptidase SppA [Terriglobales bacterium]
MTNTGKSRTWLWVLLGAGIFFVFFVAIVAFMVAMVHGDHVSGFGDKIAVVDLEGVIIEPQTVVKQLKEFADDDSIKAIILHINTPGGGVAASQEIYSEVRRVEKKKKIVASVETLGASGGYYVAVGTDQIYADPGSIVGSIGVISEWLNYADLMRWAKLKDITIKSGALKDAGNPAREMTPEERAYFQSLSDDMHGQFIAAVAEGRKMKVEDVKAIADGRVWSGQQALALHMVDKVGDFETAVDETAKSVGIKGEPELVHPEKQRRTLLDVIFGDVSNFVPDQAKVLDNHPGFYYLWK